MPLWDGSGTRPLGRVFSRGSGLFFSGRRRPRRFTLFPYTMLFRSVEPSGDLGAELPGHVCAQQLALPVGREAERRSEEHTSELQSHSDLVCRLLLEKKNKLKTRPIDTSV